MLKGIFDTILTIVFKQPEITLHTLISNLEAEYQGFSQGHISNCIFKLRTYGYLNSTTRRVEGRVVTRYRITKYGQQQLNPEIIQQQEENNNKVVVSI